jgi:hypothetical protein
MPETAYEVLARVLRDNEADANRTRPHPDAINQAFVNGLDAASARIRFAMIGLPRPGGTGPHDGGGGGDDGEPTPQAPPGDGGGKVIEADYTIVNPFSGQPQTVPKLTP